jgi:hypothetical protein
MTAIDADSAPNGGDVRIDQPFMMDTLSDSVQVTVTAQQSPPCRLRAEEQLAG